MVKFRWRSHVKIFLLLFFGGGEFSLLPKIFAVTQEGVGSITFGRHVSNRLKCIYTESWRRELLIGIFMDPIGGGGEGGGSEFLGPPLQKFTGPLLQNFNISSESSAQAQSIGTLFEQIGLRGWGLWTCPKVRGTRARVQAAG